jgi:uncharacterized damage-inducible protein DinB
MHEVQQLLIYSWQRTGEQMLRLIQDIPPAIITQQPAGLLNHPAWTVAHLCHYHPAIISLLQGKTVDDPAKAPNAERFDEGSVPVSDPDAYPSHEELMKQYTTGHAKVLAALNQTQDSILAKPAGLERWARSFASTADVLHYLMIMHESQHAGQIMSWRRLQGISLA